MPNIRTSRQTRKPARTRPETGKVGKRGAVVIPARLRRQFGIEEGELVMMEARNEGVLIRPAVALPMEWYTVRRRAEFLLNNTVTARDYRKARAAVADLGVDPDSIEHDKPPGT